MLYYTWNFFKNPIQGHSGNVFTTCRSCYKVLVPHLVIRSQFEDVKLLADKIEKDWRQVLADCFPKILVNILPYFAYQSHGKNEVAEQRDKASEVFDMLKDEKCLGKQVSILKCVNWVLCHLTDLKGTFIYAVKM